MILFTFIFTAVFGLFFFLFQAEVPVDVNVALALSVAGIVASLVAEFFSRVLKLSGNTLFIAYTAVAGAIAAGVLWYNGAFTGGNILTSAGLVFTVGTAVFNFLFRKSTAVVDSTARDAS